MSDGTILVFNAGSSSLKLGLFDATGEAQLAERQVAWDPDDAAQADAALAEILAGLDLVRVSAVGHRVVHGGTRFTAPVLIDTRVRDEVATLATLAPLHNRPALAAIAEATRLFSSVPQVAVFDTAFHETLPPHAYLYALPYEWYERWGIRRFGFHGLSHAYCAGRAAEVLRRPLAELKLVTCHLGSGCSLAAIAGGVSIATTMGFTPLDGLVMATRPGSVDPGLLTFLLAGDRVPLPAMEEALHRHSGLKGVSGRSGDMRDIRTARAAGDARSTLAFDLYVTRLREGIGAMAAHLGGLDALVFTGGVGEHASEVRADACACFAWIGLTLDEAANAGAAADAEIAALASRVRVLVLHTREDLMVARETARVLRGPGMNGALQRSLGLGSLTFYGVGVILGAGIYSILGEAAGVAGAALWWSFLLASLAALLTGLSYAELATMFPQAGAEYVYLRAAWPKAAWLPATLGWVLVATGVATAAAVSLAFAGYAARFVPFPPWPIAAALVVAVGALNVVGVREASWANIVFTLVEVAGLLALIVVGARDPDVGRVWATPPHAGVLGGAALIFFAYLGFEEIANLAEEARRPAHDLPRAILIAVAVSTTLYVLVAVASVALLEPARLAASASPLAEAMQAGAPRLAGALAGIALFATANTALIAMMAASRLLFAMARGGDAPPVLARTLAQRRTPAAAVFLVAVGALACLPLGGVGLVGSIASLLALVTFAAVNAAVVRLRFTQPEATRPFRVPLPLGRAPVSAVLGLVVAVLLLAGFAPPVYGIAGTALALAFVVQAIPWKQDPVPGESPP